MNRITADAENLLRDAASTTNEFFHKVVDMLDNKFGPEYARKNPALVAKLVESTSYEFRTGCWGAIFQDATEELSKSIGFIAAAAETHE